MIAFQTWGSAHGIVSLGMQDSQVVGSVTKDGGTHFVSSEWIRGIPARLRKNGEGLTQFLREAYATVNPLSGSGFSITVSHRGRGGEGGNEELPGIDPKLLDMLQAANREAEKAKGHSLFVFVGNTGTGKSTALNAACGRVITYNEEQDAFEAVDPIAKIGHGVSTSETLLTNVFPEHPLPGTNLVPADTGGLFDSRGLIEEIAISTSVKLCLENADSVRLLLCYSTSMAFEERAMHLSKFLYTALGRLVSSYGAHRKGIMLLLTKPPEYANRGRTIPFTREAAIEKLTIIRDDLRKNTPDSVRLTHLDFVLRENGRYIAIYDPFKPETLTHLQRVVREDLSEPISQPRGKIGVSYGPTGQLKLTEMMSAISHHGLKLYAKHGILSKEIFDLERDIENIGEKINTIHASIGEIGENMEDPVQAEEAFNRLNAEFDELIREKEDLLIRLGADKETFMADKEREEEKLRVLIEGGREDVEYWSNSAKDEGIDVETTTTTTWSTKEKNCVGQVTHRSNGSDSTVTHDFREIFKTFSYAGPEVARVVLDPSKEELNKDGASYWPGVDLDYLVGKTQFQVDYITGKGESASAHVTVYTKRELTPDFLAEKSEIDSKLIAAERQLSTCGTQISESEKQIVRAQAAKEIQGSVQERLDSLRESLGLFEADKGTLEQRLARIINERCGLVDSIRTSEPHFKFLEQFIELSQDNEIREKPIVKELLSERGKYEETH